MRNIYFGFILAISVCLFGCTKNYANTNNTQNQEQETLETTKTNTTVQLSLLSPDLILNIAHRGASGHAPEHTIEAYKLGEQMNGDYIEIDLQMTKDGVLIAMHDHEISRTSNKNGRVNELTLDEIKQLDVGSWFNEQFPGLSHPDFTDLTVPTLDEIITEFGNESNYYIETKHPEENPKMVEELIRVLREHNLVDSHVREGQVVIQSFSKESLQEVHALEPSIPLIQLFSYRSKAKITDEELEEIKKYAVGIGANYKSLSKEYVQQVRDAGLLIHPYTVNEKTDMTRLIEWGVTGMFTDYPDRLDEVLEELKGKY